MPFEAPYQDCSATTRQRRPPLPRLTTFLIKMHADRDACGFSSLLPRHHGCQFPQNHGKRRNVRRRPLLSLLARDARPSQDLLPSSSRCTPTVTPAAAAPPPSSPRLPISLKIQDYVHRHADQGSCPHSLPTALPTAYPTRYTNGCQFPQNHGKRRNVPTKAALATTRQRIPSLPPHKHYGNSPHALG